MRITVHCGTDRIGGCVTEYESNGWKLFVDYGERLPDACMPDKIPAIEGLTYGDLSKSALLITYYHGDHIGKIADLPVELSVFMGKISKEIAQELSGHLSSEGEEYRSITERLDSVDTFASGEEFSFGEFKIMPIIIDHSAFEAYAFRIEAKKLAVFHIGDLRTHGFRSDKLPKVIEKYVGKVDYVVCEAANVNRPFERLLDMLKPKAIIPILTDTPRRFVELFSERLPVILLEDGESFAAIRDPWFDTTTAKVMALRKPDNLCEVIDNPENLQWWMVDNKFLGEFQCWDDADNALRHVEYAPKRLLGYAIESDEDMAPFLYVVYNPDFTVHSKYDEGGHNPEDENYQMDCEYTPGQRVLAVIDEALVPCEVVGPLTVDFLRKDFNKYGPRSEEDFQEYKSRFWDWDWDMVVVRPLVKIKTEYGEISSETTAKRIYIFPYKTLSTNEDTPSL